MSSKGVSRRQFIETSIAGAAVAKIGRLTGTDGDKTSGGGGDAPSFGLRMTESLNAGWRFRRQIAPGSAVEWTFKDAWKDGYDDTEWDKVFLPHSWDRTAHTPWVTTNHWRGIGWYRKEFPVPEAASGRRVFLEFEGSMQVTKVWVNGHEAGEHVGGYTGFFLDVTQWVQAGGRNLVVVRADNTNSPDIPPANETNIAIYGGLYRDVWLHVTSPVYVPDGGISITTPDVGRERSTLQVTTEVRNALSSPAPVRVTSEIIAGDGQVAAKTEQQIRIAPNSTLQAEPARLSVEGAKLWHPDHPDLYTLRTRIYHGDVLADETSTRFGFRVMGYTAGKGYTINGEFIVLHGVDRRQDYGYLGDALPDAISRRDMEIIKELGANMIRTAHYVQDRSILEAADELGILVWEEIPNIKIYDYSPIHSTENGDTRYTRRYIDNCLKAMEEMVRRDRNHPSIVIWGIGDDLTGYPYLDDLREMNHRAHELDPTRWTAGRVFPFITDIHDPTNDRYFDFHKLAKEHPDWKWLWNEWGAFVNERGNLIEPTSLNTRRRDTGNVDTYRRNFVPSELSGAIFQEASWIKFEAMPWMATAKWEMFDAGCAACTGTKGIFYFYGPPEERPWGTRFTGGDYRGLTDLWRIPKASYWFVKAQWTEDPFVHVVGHWTWPGQEGKPKMVRLYSTCGEVELFLNGKSLGRKRPENTENLIAEWKSYGMWQDQYALPEGTHLRHGPFIWKDVHYQPGILRAVGWKDGKQYIDERKTAGEPFQVILKPDRSTMRSDSRDAVRVVAIIADKDGVMVPQSCPWLAFRVDGPADLLGTPVLDAVWGMAAINVNSRNSAGRVQVAASSSGLQDGSCMIRSQS
jgi:beta-galactosidase